MEYGDLVTWTNSSVLERMLALLEVVECWAGLWRLTLQVRGDCWEENGKEERAVEGEVVGRLKVLLVKTSSRIQRIIMTRQPRNQISTAVMVLAGGMVDLVVPMMLSMIMVTSSWRVSLTRGWGRRNASQERVVRMVEGR